ncbi:hypothetical protein GCM10023215_20530 [Pseudonocardia yuanmonensis]|uniref:Uncharacterized protein n=1 Tax=Pseudonocardia yuanmonensis TaxID=1095914 RepID=A0ABP8WB47_9PSEU
MTGCFPGVTDPTVNWVSLTLPDSAARRTVEGPTWRGPPTCNPTGQGIRIIRTARTRTPRSGPTGAPGG